MSVEQAIHEHWDSYRPLTNLVPIEKVFTGTAVFNEGQEDVYPYVTLELVGDANSQRTSSGNTLSSPLFRFNIWVGDEQGLDKAKPIRDEILTHFNRADFDWSRGRVLDMKRENVGQIQDEGGGWHIMVDMLTRVEERD